VIGYGNPAGSCPRSKLRQSSGERVSTIRLYEIHDTDTNRTDPSPHEETQIESQPASPSTTPLTRSRRYIFPAEIHTDSPTYCNPAYRISKTHLEDSTESLRCGNSSDSGPRMLSSNALTRCAPNGEGTGFAIGMSPHTHLWESNDALISSSTTYRTQFSEPVKRFLKRC